MRTGPMLCQNQEMFKYPLVGGSDLDPGFYRERTTIHVSSPNPQQRACDGVKLHTGENYGSRKGILERNPGRGALVLGPSLHPLKGTAQKKTDLFWFGDNTPLVGKE